MKPGGGKEKGGRFERTVCKQLSLWVSGGKRTDLYWRSAMSGGRATVARQRGRDVRQAGDICAVAPEGHVLTDRWYIETKHVRDLQILAFVLKGRGGLLAKYWAEAERKAAAHQRSPMLIACQNLWPAIMLVPFDAVLLTPPLLHVHGVALHLFDQFLEREPPPQPAKPKPARPRL